MQRDSIIRMLNLLEREIERQMSLLHQLESLMAHYGKRGVLILR